MRSKPLLFLGSLVVVATLVIVACNGSSEDPPLALRAPDVTVDEQRIPADGISSVEVTVTVLSTEGMKAENVPIDFTARSVADTAQNLGTLSHTSVLTDAEGQATVSLTSIESATDTSAVVRAAVGDTTGTGVRVNPKTGAVVPAVSVPPGAVVIVSSAPLDEEELETRLHTVLLQRATERASERQRGLSSILGDPQTGEGAGSQAVDLTEQVVVFEGIVISLTSNKSALPADGVSTATIEARVRTSRGINVQSVPLIFSAGEGKITPTSTTDQFGSATATLTDAITDSTEDVVVVRMGYFLTDTLQVPYVQPVLTIAADDANIAADGSSTTTVRARLLTPAGNPVAGASVAFSLTGPNDASITVQGTTSSSGEATAVQLLGLNVTLTPAKTSILANGSATTAITLLAKTQTTNVAVVGQEVTFATDLGTIPATATTNSSGIASVNLTSATSPGTATVTANLGTVTVTTTVSFTATANISVELTGAAERLLRDGQDKTTITASVVDGEGNALSGRVVNFSLTGQGVLSTTQPQQTSAGGTATVDLEADASTTDGSAQIIAISEGQSDTLTVPLRGITLVLTSSPAAIVANGTNRSTLTMLVKETTTNAGVPGRDIQFASTLGTIPATATTGLSGVASVELISGTTAGTATVTGTLGTLSTTTDVDLQAEALTVSIAAGSGSILRDGIATVDVTITAQDPNGNLLNDRDVSWAISGSSASLFPAVGQTGQGSNPSGTHKTTLTADANSADATATVTATVGDSTASIAIDLTGVSLTSFVQPDTILANGTETAVFRWQATKTTSGAVIPSHQIVIRKVSGPNVLLSGIANSTDASGIATVTVTSTTNSGDLVMEAELGGVTRQETLHLLADQFSVALSSDEATLLRDGSQTAELKAVVLDKLGDPVADQRVDFALVSGSGTLDHSFSNTSSSGEATVNFAADVASTNVNAVLRAFVSTVADTLTIPLYGVVISIATDPDSLVADRTSEVEVEVTVKEAGTSTPLTGRTVYFAVGPGTFGTISALDVTDSRGVAVATLTGDTTASFTATVYGRLGDNPSTALVDSTTLSVVAPVRNVTLTSADEGILRNNLSATTLTARVTDDSGFPIDATSVAWSLTGATPAGASLSVSSSQTNSNGEATVILTGDAGSADAVATIQAAVGSATGSSNVTLQGVSISIEATPTTITANGIDASTIEATLQETVSGRGIAGETVTFSTSLGVIGGTATTDANGQASVNLIGGKTAGTANVKAYNGPLSAGIIDSVSVVITAPVAGSIALLATPDVLQPKGTGGTESSSITATILDAAGEALPAGIQVAFALSPSTAGTFGGTATVDTVETDGDGVASTSFQSGTIATPVTISANVVGTSIQSSDAILAVAAGPVAHLDIAVTPISWNDDGLYERELHIVVTDTFSNSVTNQLILWRGEPDSLENSVVPIGEESRTDNTGVAHSLLIYNRGYEPIAFTLYAEAENGVVQSRVLGDGDINVVTGSTTLVRDGLSTTDLTGTVSDLFGTKVGLTTIGWAIQSGTGTLTSSASLTDADGEATGSTTYQSDGNSADGSVTIRASYLTDELTKDITITLKGVTLNLTASKAAIIDDNVDTATITLEVLETTTGIPVEGKTVSFSTDLGSVFSAGETDSLGRATATFRSASAGAATITGTLGSLSTTVGVTVSARVLSVSATDALGSILRDGESTTTGTATVTDNNGDAVSGETVTWSVSAGTGSVSPLTSQTDTAGVATTTFTADAAAAADGSGTIQAAVTGDTDTRAITLRGVTLSLVLDKSAIIDDDTDSATLTLQALETSSGNPVAGRTITFSTDLGQVTTSSTSDSDGKATATFKSSSAGAATITGSLGSRSTTVGVTVNARALSVAASAGTSSILREGVSTSTVTATVTDNNGNAASGETVTWSVSAGTGSVSPLTATTDANGQATTTFTSDAAAATDGSGTVQAAVTGDTDTAVITLRGVTFTLSAQPDSLSANGLATTTVTALVKETTANVALNGLAVSFSTDLGTIGGTATTGTDGKASVTFTAGTTTGLATVSADYGSLTTATTSVELITSASAAIALASSVDSLAVLGTGGIETSTITATVWDAYGQLVPTGTSVNLVASTGTFSNGLASITRLTGANGQVTFTYQSGATAGSVTFTATSGTATGSAPLLTIQFGAATQVLVTTDLTQAVDKQNGTFTLAVAALVSDANGDIVDVGSVVFFDITVGATFAQVSPWIATDADGIAEATLVYPTASIAQSVTVRATIGGVSQTLVIVLPQRTDGTYPVSVEVNADVGFHLASAFCISGGIERGAQA